ncbi:hemolysin family protein [soil metagenome]
MPAGLSAALVFLSLLAAAVLVMADVAIGRVGRAKAHHLAQEKKPGAVQLVRIVEDPAPFMNVLVFLRLLAYVTGVAAALSLADAWAGRFTDLLAVLVMCTLFFVFAEIGPRNLAVQRTEQAALLGARPVFVLGKLLGPVGRLLVLVANVVLSPLPGRALRKGPFVSDEEMRHEANGEEEEEEIEEEERELIHSIFEFGETIVREVMVPRPDMVTVAADADLDAALAMITEVGYSRIPIYEGDTDNIIGVLYAKDLLKRGSETPSDKPVRSLGRAPLFVPEQKKVAELLREMQQQRVHMAIVIDEYGGTAGLVTIEDVIEEIVGEIVDEYDQEEPLVEPIDENTLRVDAKMAIDEVNELLDADLPHEEWDTVGGLVFGLTGRVPLVDETVRFDSLEFRTERVSGRRIQKVVISRRTEMPGQAE